jgi:uncharacterized protein (DUF1697 family)
MPSYVAFLRGINVSGQKIIKMTELCRMFQDMGFKKVKTYIQTGNVIFDTASANTKTLTSKIEKDLQKQLGYKVTVVLRTIPEIETILTNNPFKKLKLKDNERIYITLLSGVPTSAAIAELGSVQSDVDTLMVQKSEVYILCRGGYGESVFSNNLVEKKLNLSATTRNLNTMVKVTQVQR